MAAQPDPDEPLLVDTPASPAPGEPLPEMVVTPVRVPWWPFLAYLAVWTGFIAAAAWRLYPAGDAAFGYGTRPWAYAVFAGLLLVLFGPAVTFLVWLVSWLSAGRGVRAGLLSTALIRGAIVTLAGVLAWWGMLVWLDATRLGKLW